MTDHDTHAAAWKLALVWLGTFFGSVTLSQMVLFATLIFTLAQLFFLLRDKWWRERK